MKLKAKDISFLNYGEDIFSYSLMRYWKYFLS